jgi:Methyltransferase domain
MLKMAQTRQLSEQQTESFNVEYVTDELWRVVAPRLERYLGHPSRFLDVGGGVGLFADRVLAAFPFTSGTILEPAINLSARNRADARKRVLNGAFQTTSFAEGEKFDVIFFNWVLHHFVVSGYKATVEAQIAALQASGDLLHSRGAIFIFENFYDGWIIDDLPSRIIYGLTASRALRPITARLAANTAGVGVSFHSESGWRRLVNAAGLNLSHVELCYSYWAFSSLRRALLHIEDVHVGLLIAKKLA